MLETLEFYANSWIRHFICGSTMVFCFRLIVVKHGNIYFSDVIISEACTILC